MINFFQEREVLMEDIVKLNNSKSSFVQLLKNTNFSLLFFGRLVSQLGDAVYTIALGWFILDLTHSGAHMGIYMAVGALVSIVAGPVGGVISDKFNRVRLIYLTDFMRGIAVISAGIIVYSNFSVTVTLISLYGVNIIIRLCSTIFEPASNAILPSIINESQLTKANSMNAMIISMANIVGLVVGAVLYAKLGIFGIFIINSISYILSAFSEMFIKLKDHLQDNSKEHQLKKTITDLKEGFTYVFRNRGLFTIIIFCFIINFLFVPIFAVFIPFIFNQILKTDVIELSYIQVAASIGFILGSIIVSTWKKKLTCKKTLMAGNIVLLPLTIIFTVLIQSRLSLSLQHTTFLFDLIIVMILIGIPISFINIPISVAIQTIVPTEILGRVTGILSTLVLAATPLGMVLSGIIVDTLPIVNAMIVINGLFLFTIVALWVNKKYIDF